jgi:eukaryotic-like serine/threonine-protein kinase
MTDPDRVCSRCGATYPGDVIFCPKDGTPLGTRKTEVLDDPYVDLSIAGQFRVEQLIGIGAMGRVYRAHQSGIDRDVAIKILHRELLRNPTVIARFHREAKVASRLVHPNVVQMLMTGELDRVGPDVGGEAYLVMEFLDGISLRSALAAAGGAMPLPRALHVVLQVCDAVGEAHSQGIVHRDLKPENVMLVKRGDDADFAKVLDFGVARLDWSESSMATQAGVIFGTARYISPEGAQGEKVGAPGDVYSIATMLYQCLCGETPFDGDSSVAILLKHTSTPAADVRTRHRASYVPEPIARVLAANLVKNPAERCRDARELGRALVEAARSAGLSPDDLVLRSTLVASARGPLQLASMERTKKQDLTPELARRLAPDSKGPNDTQLLEEPAKLEPTRVSQPPAPTSVEPTISDEPAAQVPSIRSAPISAPFRPSIPSSGTVSSSTHPSFPDADYEPPLDVGTASLRRWLVIGACFAFGAMLTAVVAHRLGAFPSRAPGVDSYAQRAQRALEAGAWDAPPGENVRDITDSALRRWPDAPSVLAVRRDAARVLVERARGLGAGDRRKASRMAELATELDPSNDASRVLAAELNASPPVLPELPPVPSTAPATVAPRPVRSTKPRAPAAPAPRPETAPAEESATPRPAPPPAGGRWL